MGRLTGIRLVCVALASASVPAVACAQTAPNQSAPSPKNPSDSDGDQTLSDRLSRDKGVIRPPDVEAPNGIEKTPPEQPGRTMPVIPPPGSPGGDPSVEPK